MKFLLIGDIVARPGRRVLKTCLQSLVEANQIDFTLVNVENAAGGFGLTRKVFDEFAVLDIDVMTSGNHIWDKREVLDFIDAEPKLLRPHNYPDAMPGCGWRIYRAKNGIKVGVMNLMGQAFMHPTLDSPYHMARELLSEHAAQADVVLLDYHAETTSEKMGMGWFLDGKVSAVVGTHTHVPTADERILPAGTAYITDLGMTGCYDSVIGSKVGNVLTRMVDKLPARLEAANGPATLCGVIIEIDPDSGLATSINRIKVNESNL